MTPSARLRTALLLLALSVVSIVAISWPFAPRLLDQTLGDVDALFSIWRLAWIADTVAQHGGRGLFDAPIFHPSVRAFAYSDAILLPGVMAAPLRWLGATPMVAFNLFTLAAAVGSCLAAAWLAYTFTGDWRAAAFGGLVFAYGPHRMEHFERLELVASYFVPLAFICHYHAVSSGRWRWAAALPLSVAAQFLTGMYQGLFLGTVAPILALDLLWHSPNRRRSLAGLLSGGIVALIAVGVYALPYLASQAELGARAFDDVVRYSATPSNFLAVHPRNWWWGAWLSPLGSAERYLFPGALALVLAVVGAATLPRRWLLLYGLVALLAIDITLGVNGIVFPHLRDVSSAYRGIRSPVRSYVVVLVPLSLCAAVGLQAVIARLPGRARGVIAAVVLAATVAEYRMPPHLWRVEAPAAVGSLGIDHHSVILDLPLPHPDRLDLSHDVHYMIGRIGTWSRELNGYSGQYPPHYPSLVRAFADFPSHRALARAVAMGATHVAIHERWLDRHYTQWVDWMRLEARWRPLGEYQELDGRVAVFSLK